MVTQKAHARKSHHNPCLVNGYGRHQAKILARFQITSTRLMVAGPLYRMAVDSNGEILEQNSLKLYAQMLKRNSVVHRLW